MKTYPPPHVPKAPSIENRDSMNSRNVDYGRAESDLSVNLKKAISPEETAPKRKHVRSCIVYTWDHRSSQSYWAGLKILPILADEVQTFKALICTHKVLQEGHPVTLREAQAQIGWLESCGRSVSGEGNKGQGYGPLIRAYVQFLLEKLSFHRIHTEFNGTFEYEEYVSLKNINDPNEGYETISDLMNLQDKIDSFEKLIFAHFRPGANVNECRISALVPLVHESYGIYKFVTSMLRAMHQSTQSEDALEALRARFNSQHHRLLRFYYECSNLRYLTNLISIPKLPQDPPGLMEDEGTAPELPSRPSQARNGASTPSTNARGPYENPESITDFWSGEQVEQEEEYESTQQRLREQRDAEIAMQQQEAISRQQEFERIQSIQAEQQQQAQEKLLTEQYQRHTEGRLAELEREILSLRGQYDNDQLLLEQYDRKVKSLELDLQQVNGNFQLQLDSKDDLIKSLQDQLTMWKNKYESLAKLYSQLRQEHINLLSKFKQTQLKASSAQGAVEKREKLERELKSKNLELADLIRERDRARHELDRAKGSHITELESVRRDLRVAQEASDKAERAKGSELSLLLAKHNREIADMEQLLNTNAAKRSQIEEQADSASLQNMLREKEEEIDIYKAGMDSTLMQLKELQMADTEQVLDHQVDNLILDHLKQLKQLIGKSYAVLRSAVTRIDDSIFELESPMQAGNQNSTPRFVLSTIEKGSSSATDFALSFNNFIAEGPANEIGDVISSTNVFTSAIADIIINCKGLSRFADNEKDIDSITTNCKAVALAAKRFFSNLLSFKLENLSQEHKTEVVISANLNIQKTLQTLNATAESFLPSSGISLPDKDLGDAMEQQMTDVANAVSNATIKLQALLPSNHSGTPPASSELQIHESLLSAAVAITNAIARLVAAATDTQREIVALGRGSSSSASFYRRHHRWTEGLISASKTVAFSTNMLLETADGVVNDRSTAEHLLVSCNDVAAATAQLVAASRVKASAASKNQDRLEDASRAVNSSCRALVRAVENMRAARNEEQISTDYGKLATHEFKVCEMEQQVEILKLENNLSQARKRLGEMRKVSYQQGEI